MFRRCIGALVAAIVAAGSSSSEALDKPAAAAAASAADETQLVNESDLVFSFAPMAPPVRPGKTPILIRLENRSKYPLRFSLLEDWVKVFGFFYRDKKKHPTAGGGGGWGESYCFSPGTTICHLVTNLLVIPPGGTIFRGAEIDLTPADPGTVNLTIDVRLVEVPVDFSCAHTRMLSGHASQVVDIVRNNKR
jgi:hypothetical protein